MDPQEEMLQQLGTFEPMDAKRLLPLLEAEHIAFEVEADDSALLRPNRWMSLAVGIYPEGSKVLVFVSESDLPRAMEILETLFPV